MTALLISQIFIVITLEQNKISYTLNLEFRCQQVKNLLTYRGIDLWGKIKPEVQELSWVSFKKKDETKNNSKL